MLVTALTFLPAAFQKRQSVWVYVSLAGPILAGLLVTRRSPLFQGLLTFGAAPSVNHILVVPTIVIALVRALTLGHAPAHADPKRERWNRRLLLNGTLPVMVLPARGFVAALSHPLPPD